MLESGADRLKIVLMALGTGLLFLALWGGLVRIGWYFPPLRNGLPAMHGPLIVCGFVGTFFALERAVTLNQLSAYVLASVTALGGLAILAAPNTRAAQAAVVVGSVAFLVLCARLYFHKRTDYSAYMFLGSFHWIVASLMWLAGWPVYTIVLWWMSFVLFSTAGERIELMKMGHLPLRERLEIGLGVFLVFVGHVTMAVTHMIRPEALDLFGDAIYDPRVKAGMQVAGVGILLAAFWFLRNDMARRALGKPGLAGYIAFCLVSSYFWLAVNGVFCVWFAGLVSGFVYDAFVHTFFIGFLLFMIFGHAPILLPAYLNLFLSAKRMFYVPAVLLHLSLVLRMAGDVGRSLPVRKWGALVNTAAIVVFVVMVIVQMAVENWPARKAESAEEAAGS